MLLPAIVAILSLIVAELPPKPAGHDTLQIEGWTVRMDQRLRTGDQAALGDEAAALLRSKLREIAVLLPPDNVTKLREVVIWLDLNCGALTSMQYHPSAAWLEKNGYSRELAKSVHLPVAARFTDPRHQQVQPNCVLHELAHAYHDQVLGFENARVLEVWERYVASGRGKRVLHVDGRFTRHYAMANQKEFFAEMTEAYFGANDFHPFVHGELKHAEPETWQLLREIWGPAKLARED